MTQAKGGDTVRIHYTGRLTDGRQFESSVNTKPIEFQLGAGQVIPGLEKKIVGMDEGQTATIAIAASEAYGAHRPELVQSMPRSRFPEGMQLSAGEIVEGTTSDGHEVALTVVDVGPEAVILDANHPLAGHDLVFDVELIEVIAA